MNIENQPRLTNFKSQVAQSISHDCASDKLDRTAVSDELVGLDSDYRDWNPLWDSRNYLTLSHFFMKPKLILSALPPVKYQVHDVRWLNKDGIWEELGARNVFFTYLRLENKGRAAAKDCSVNFTTPEGHGPFVFPQEIPLVYTSIVGHGFDIVAGMRCPYQIIIGNNPIPMTATQTIAKKGGKSTVLLLFVVEGFKQSIVCLATPLSSAGLPLEARTIQLRTTTDGKLHKVKLQPAEDGSYPAEILD